MTAKSCDCGRNGRSADRRGGGGRGVFSVAGVKRVY